MNSNHRILVDANVYLRFYDTKDGLFKTLLEFLKSISGNLFVSEIIKNEVTRNKMFVAINSINSLEKNFKVKGSDLPVQFGDENSKKWNESIRDLEQIQKKQKAFFSALINLIWEGKDSVSQSLNSILSSAKKYSSDEIKLAEERKKLGIPPGKKGDPIGDELTWVQFLETINADSIISIVSYDTDYFDVYSGKPYLNPILVEDLLKKGVNINNIYIYNKLSEFYKSVKVEVPEREQIDDKLVEKIIDVEAFPKIPILENALYPLSINDVNYDRFFGTSGLSGTTIIPEAYSNPLRHDYFK